MLFSVVKMLVLPLKIVPLLLFSETISFEGEVNYQKILSQKIVA